jgi:hypothetical protein
MPRLFRPLFLFGCLLVMMNVARAATPDWWAKLEVRDLAGAVSQPDGRWLVLVFVSPECPVVNANIPTLNALATEFASRGVGFVGVYSDSTLDLPALRQHAAEFQGGFAAVDDRSQRLVRFLGATYTPEVFVFARDDGRLLYHGRIDDRVEDFGRARPVATRQDLRDVLTALVAGRLGPFENRPGFGCAISQPVPK